MSPASGFDPVSILTAISPSPAVVADDVVCDFATVFAGVAPTAFEPQIETSVNASPGEAMLVAVPRADGAAPGPAATAVLSLKSSAVFASPIARVDPVSPGAETQTGTVGAVVGRENADATFSTPIGTDGAPPAPNGDQPGRPDDRLPKASSDLPSIDVTQTGVAPIAAADRAPSLPDQLAEQAGSPVPATTAAELPMLAQAVAATPILAVAAAQPTERARTHVRGGVEQVGPSTAAVAGQRPDVLRADPVSADVAHADPAPVAIIVAAEPRTVNASASASVVRVMTEMAHADPVIRTPGFTGQLDQIARDLVVMSGDRDMRFNVRPEALGPVSVTISRGDDGPTLRLGVENHAAMQAARAAEPLLTDGSVRNGTPFAQVTIDMSAHDQRGRSARAAVALKRGQVAEADNSIQRAPVKTGRFA